MSAADANFEETLRHAASALPHGTAVVRRLDEDRFVVDFLGPPPHSLEISERWVREFMDSNPWSEAPPTEHALWEFLWVSLLEVDDQERTDTRLKDLYEEPPT